MAIIYTFTPTGIQNRRTLRVATEAPAEAGVGGVGQICKRGFAANGMTDGNVNTFANLIRCKMVYSYLVEYADSSASEPPAGTNADRR